LKTYSRIPLAEFLPQLSNPQFYGDLEQIRFSDEQAYHIYAELDLNLDLAAAEDASKAMRYLELIEDFATISDRVCQLAGASILEVQGSRIHFLLPALPPKAFPEGLVKVVAFSAALMRMAYAELRESAGDHWKGFSIAADYGLAVFVPSTFGGGSVVSLGRVANRPAKRLSQGVASGHLALPSELGGTLPGGVKSGDWTLLHVNQPSAELAALFDRQLDGDISRIARGVLLNPTRAARAFVNIFSADTLGKQPLRDRGMCLRADLDGFTKAVEAAFAGGPAAVMELVRHFTEIMEYPREFMKLQPGRRIVELPWAGDCCTLFVRPASNESVEDLRQVFPVEGGRLWHGVADTQVDIKRWKSALGDAKWATGFACGDADEGGNGWAIVAEIPTSKRRFRVIAGWCARRAQDAQECTGIGAEHVALPKVDFDNLEAVLKPLFRDVANHPTYSFSTYAKLKEARQSIARSLAGSTPVRATGVTTSLPRPRPYGLRYGPDVPAK
jgi:hypothetical protein